MILNRLLSAVVVLCLLVSSAVGMARAMGTGVFVTICAGGESRTVELGADGAPVADHVHCADCVMLVGLVPTGAPLVVPVLVRFVRDRPAHCARLMRGPILSATARAPPASV